MADGFEYDKEAQVINEFMEQQSSKINELQRQILFLNTKNIILEKDLAELKIINRQQQEEIERLTKVDRKSLSASLDKNRGIRNAIND